SIDGTTAGFRFFYDGCEVSAPTSGAPAGWWAGHDTQPHHLAVTWDNGIVKLFFDGTRIAHGACTMGPVLSILGDLRFGESVPPQSPSTQRLLGLADDVLILERSLTDAEVALLAQQGAEEALFGQTCSQADFDDDGDVDLLDYAEFEVCFTGPAAP
ncbi:MAG: LamG domain-containing protein, partial [Phycisphaerae bacterium]|nr:LamG domain-containing protein [Phycisphaerae bacterium]